MINYEIQKHIATISSTATTEKALTLTSWNGNPAKYDLRVWTIRDGNKAPGRGVTLTTEEAAELAKALTECLPE